MGEGAAAGVAGTGGGASTAATVAVTVGGGRAAEDDELGGLGSGGDLGPGALEGVFGGCDWEESRRSPLREFLPPRLLRPPSKLRSCCPNVVSEGRCGEGREVPTSLGPRSFLLRFGGIVKGKIAEVGSFIELRRVAGSRRRVSQSMECRKFRRFLSAEVRWQVCRRCELKDESEAMREAVGF
jgi:hypothetical protein